MRCDKSIWVVLIMFDAKQKNMYSPGVADKNNKLKFDCTIGPKKLVSIQ